MAQRTVGEKPELHIVRRYPVAPGKVWAAWTDPQALSRWFGPGGMNSVTVAELDVRTGGRYRIRFATPDGEEHEVGGAYLAVAPPHELAFSWAWHSTPDRVSEVRLRLRPVDEGTELDFRQTRFFDQAARDNHEHGWSLTFAKLDGVLAAP